MRWLDTDESREIDPVLDCLTYLARQSDRPSSPVLLRAGLALSADGKLPFHQIEPALEQVGMRADEVKRSLKNWPSTKCPAVLELEDGRAAVLLERREGDGLVYAPGVAEPMWVPARRARARLHRPRGRRRNRPDPRARERAAVGQGQAPPLVLVGSVEGSARVLAGYSRGP